VRRCRDGGDCARRDPARGRCADVARRDAVARRDDPRQGDRVRIVDAIAGWARDGTHWASPRARPLGDDRDGETARHDGDPEPAAAAIFLAVLMPPKRVYPAPTSPAAPGGPRAVKRRDVAR